MRNSGFILLETLVALTILSIGLILVARSYITSLDAFRKSSEYSQAILITEKILWDLLQKKEDLANTKSGDLAALGKTFYWRFETTFLDLPLLKQARLEILWKGKRKKEALQIVTYLRLPR